MRQFRPSFFSVRRMAGAWPLGLLLAAAIPVHAQQAGQGPVRSAPGAMKTAPSPLVPGDLTRPIFDTKTAIYGAGTGMEKGAATIVAEVEGRAITLGDVGDAIHALPPALAQLPFETLYPGIVEQLIKQEAVVVRAQQQGLDEDPTVRRRVRTAADRTLANEWLRRELSRGVTETMLLDRYNREIAGKAVGEEVRARIILTPTEKDGLALIAELRAGADFAGVARRVSKDPTASIGGDLGFQTREGLAPEVSAVAFALPPGQMAQYPVRSGGNWFIVKVEERRRATPLAFPAAREILARGLEREGAESLSATIVSEMKVREYNLLGKEMAPDKPEAR